MLYETCLLMWSTSFHAQIVQILHLVEQLCIALQDEFRTYLTSILPNCIQVLVDAERCNDFSYVPDILHTFEVFGGQYNSSLGFLLLFKLCIMNFTWICLAILFCHRNTGWTHAFSFPCSYSLIQGWSFSWYKTACN